MKNWPVEIEAGDKRLLLRGRPPLVDCRVVSEELYQKFLLGTIPISTDPKIVPSKKSTNVHHFTLSLSDAFMCPVMLGFEIRFIKRVGS